MTVTYFCDIDTHLNDNFAKGNVSETTEATATLSCRHTARTALIRVDGICDLPFAKKGQNAFTYFSVFRLQYADDLT